MGRHEWMAWGLGVLLLFIVVFSFPFTFMLT